MELEKNDIPGAIFCITSTSLTRSELYAFSEKVRLYLLNNSSNRFQKDTLISSIRELNNIDAGSDWSNPN